MIPAAARSLLWRAAPSVEHGAMRARHAVLGFLAPGGTVALAALAPPRRPAVQAPSRATAPYEPQLTSRDPIDRAEMADASAPAGIAKRATGRVVDETGQPIEGARVTYAVEP